MSVEYCNHDFVLVLVRADFSQVSPNGGKRGSLVRVLTPACIQKSNQRFVTHLSRQSRSEGLPC